MATAGGPCAQPKCFGRSRPPPLPRREAREARGRRWPTEFCLVGSAPTIPNAKLRTKSRHGNLGFVRLGACLRGSLTLFSRFTSFHFRVCPEILKRNDRGPGARERGTSCPARERPILRPSPAASPPRTVPTPRGNARAEMGPGERVRRNSRQPLRSPCC